MPTDGKSFAQGSLRLGLAAGGSLRWAVADISEVVEAARERLDLSPVASAALGRGLAGAALLLRLAAKTPHKLVLEIKGDGPIRQVVAEADHEGNLRGLVGHRQVDVPPTPAGKLAVGQAVGKGRLRVMREHTGGTYHSQVELVSGEIGDDIAHYLEQSEQRRSAVLVGVLARPAGVAAAGGMIIEVLPGAPEEVLELLEANIRRTSGVSRLVEDGGEAHVLDTFLAGMDRELLEESRLHYRCRCSRERLHRHLAVLSADDLEPLVEEDGEVSAECLFCGSTYHFSPEELGAE